MTDFDASRLATRVLTVVSLLCWCLGSYAHELRPSVADIDVTPEFIDISMRVNLEALISEIGPAHSDSDDAPQASTYNRLRHLPAATLEAEFQQYLSRFLNQIALTTDIGIRLPLVLASITIPPVDDTRLPRDSIIVLQAVRPSNQNKIYWFWAGQYGAIILRVDSSEVSTLPIDSTIVETSADPASEDDLISSMSPNTVTQYVKPGDISHPITLDRSRVNTRGSSVGDYVLIGFEHIIPKGLDHILFVIGLFLLAPRFKHIAWQVSMFTLAHTLTLALGITGLFRLPAQVVEPLIALSITIICVENLFGDRFRIRRLLIVFVFGLLHGLGFAAVLSDIGLPTGQFVSSLMAFNVGVELGQLTVVLICFALVGWWFGHKCWYRAVVTIPSSLIVGAVGLFWFLQRVHVL